MMRLVNAGTADIGGRLARTLRSWAADTRGSAAVLSAVLFPVVIGGMGLGAETGYWYMQQRELQHAADLAAHAAGTRKRAGDSSTRMRQAALQIATKAGFDDDVGDLTVNVPPTSASYRANRDALEVVLTRNTPRLFSRSSRLRRCPWRRARSPLFVAGTRPASSPFPAALQGRLPSPDPRSSI
jgi:Flp pilus assembly protein TadG